MSQIDGQGEVAPARSMNSHALRVLEFGRVLHLVAERASSALGAARVRERSPSADLGAIEHEHARVQAMRGMLESDEGWSMQPIPELTASFARLRTIGTTLSPEELLAALTLLRSSRLTAAALQDPRRPAVARALLASVAQRLVSAPVAEEAILRVVAEDGTVRDDASPLLRRVRRELRNSEAELVALLERIMGRLESHQVVPDMSVTVRNGRYVIPVRREARGAVGGIVHGASATGATLFVEPPAAIDACNRIRELEAEEIREVDRLLLELTDRLRPYAEELLDSLDALVELDDLYARSRFARDFDCGTIRFGEPGTGFHIREGRHPLLVAQGLSVVSFDLQMHADERTLLVSGPNTGGKTVLLKALGLFSLLAQSGIPVTAGTGSSIVVYDDVFADIGDEQSIEASLSTFSAHLRNLGEILRGADARTLVLIDELGSGTDPLEGSALGGAILEELTTRGASTVATTHLGALKELASEVPGIVNASLEFDAVALAPTYRLVKGIPGRSYGISIARRLALPEDVIVRAEERLPRAERDVNALLERLEERDRELAAKEAELRTSTTDAQQRARRLAEREQRVREREREVERESRREARKFLLAARADVERTIRELRGASSEAVEEAAREARRHIEQLAAEQGERLARLGDEPVAPVEGETPSGAPNVGDLVEITTLEGRTGLVLEFRGSEAVVAMGDVKMTFPVGALRRSSQQRPAGKVTVPVTGDLPEVLASSEIDLRGLRAGDVEEVVLQALDAAIRADLRSLRIIHGKGTGALRERVSEMLRKDTRVRSFRLGAWNEGGSGVTIADL